MPSLKNNRLLNAIWRKPVDATPIWIMRQAGRYLPEYRKTRERAGSFMTLCQTPELACEVTLQPLARFDLDAAIIFSDILTIPDAMGLGLHFVEGEGPKFSKRIQRAEDINQLFVPDLDRLKYVYDAIRLVKQELDNKIPLIGFAGSPWTLAAYIVEGQSQPGFPALRRLQQESPLLLHHLLDLLATAVTHHLNAQIEAGVDVVKIFDTWGGLLETETFAEYSLSYIKQVISGLKTNYNNKRIPVILFTKRGNRWLEMMSESGCDVVGVDWEISLNEARKRVGEKVVLQGNLDPSILMSGADVIRKEALRVLDSFGHGAGHIFNLGHGITPEVPPENVSILVDAVHELSQSYHAQQMVSRHYGEAKLTVIK